MFAGKRLMTTNKDRMDPRVIRTRKLLKDALLSLIPEKSFESITIKDITDCATLNRVTFYLHYDNKLDLLQDASNEIFDELIQSYTGQTIFGSPEETHSIIQANFDHLHKYKTFYKAMLGREGVLSFIRTLEDYVYERNLKRVREKRGEKSDINLDRKILIRHLATGLVGIASWWLENDQPCSPSEMADRLLVIFQEGYYNPLLRDQVIKKSTST
jgi:AcrR family transcriptional regulator